jgi:predicted dinucleotide-binding enzyme
MPLNISILGAGKVGGTLGSRLAAKGHFITYLSKGGAQSPRLKLAVSHSPGSTVASSLTDALAGAEVVILCVPLDEVEGLVEVRMAVWHAIDQLHVVFHLFEAV